MLSRSLFRAPILRAIAIPQQLFGVLGPRDCFDLSVVKFDLTKEEIELEHLSSFAYPRRFSSTAAARQAQILALPSDSNEAASWGASTRRSRRRDA